MTLLNRQRRTRLDLRRIADALRRYEPRVPRTLSAVSVVIVSDRTISRLNGTFLGRRGPTDVLSFRTGAYADVIVSAETAARQARDADHSVEKEIFYLALHGVLHLSGYDDRAPAPRARMLAAQDALCAELWNDDEPR